jgi:hypothetical protein
MDHVANAQPYTSHTGANVHAAVHALQLWLTQVDTAGSTVDCHQDSTAVTAGGGKVTTCRTACPRQQSRCNGIKKVVHKSSSWMHEAVQSKLEHTTNHARLAVMLHWLSLRWHVAQRTSM